MQLSFADPEAHYSRAVVLFDTAHYQEATQEFERAVAFRPRDYFLWLELGRARDQMNDTDGALVALKQAVRLAPYYAQPRWQLGNLLVRAGDNDQGFAELRHATESDPTLFPALIDLAWGVSGGDARVVEQLAQAQVSAQRVALARFFVKHEKADEAMQLFRAAGDVSDKDRHAFLSELLARKQFTEAYEVWSSVRNDKSDNAPRSNHTAAIFNSGFESEIRLDDPGFNWQIVRKAPGLRVSLDATERFAGSRSLRVDFSGASPASVQIASQFVLIEPKARYRLSFMARTQELVTGGPTEVTLSDAGDEGHTLAQSKPLVQGTSQWQNYTIEFETPQIANAIIVALRRQNCVSAPCPVFGSAWFDNFSLVKL